MRCWCGVSVNMMIESNTGFTPYSDKRVDGIKTKPMPKGTNKIALTSKRFLNSIYTLYLKILSTMT
jgi:hypothetical protein